MRACRLAKVALTLTSLLYADSVLLAQPSGVQVLTRLADVGPAIRACWRPPAASAGMELTLVFSFKRSGEILGAPRISFAKLHGDQEMQKQFVASALNALGACTPLKLTTALGAAMAGRPFAMLFKAESPSRRI